MASNLPFIQKTGAAFDGDATKAKRPAFNAAARGSTNKGQPEVVYEVRAAASAPPPAAVIASARKAAIC